MICAIPLVLLLTRMCSWIEPTPVTERKCVAVDLSILLCQSLEHVEAFWVKKFPQIIEAVEIMPDI